MSAEHPLPPRPTLTEEQKRIIKSSADALAPEVFGTKVTARMYETMLRDNTQLKDIFSYSKQATGKQPLALARAVHAYAQHIYDLSPIVPVVEGIAHKHASLHIEPYQYSIVATHLMAALSEELKEAFTTELRDAWAAGYWALAYIFIDMEHSLYEAAGWEGWRKFVVHKRVDESDDITSFYLKPKDGLPLKPWHPGQYISVQVYVDELKSLQSRQYSLSNTPNPDHFRISVKREKGTLKEPTNPAAGSYPARISNLLHSTKLEGSEVEASFAFGEFFLDKSSPSSAPPVVLLSAGVGLTPVLSMLNTLVGPHNEVDGKVVRPVTWIQGLRSPAEHPFTKHIRELAKKHPEQLKIAFFYSRPTDVETAAFGEDEFKGHANIEQFLLQNPLRVDDGSAFESTANRRAAPVLLHLDKKETHYYVCGPTGFMNDVRHDLVAAGVDNGRVHEETFVA